MCCTVESAFLNMTHISQVGDYYMDYTDVLDIRVYIPMLLVVLIPIGLIRDLKYLVPFSAMANIFILVSFIITLYYIFSDSLNTGDKEYMANVTQLPLFFATVIFAMEGIGVVRVFTVISVSRDRRSLSEDLSCQGR
jgi:proton-coupled amino acid transporter